MCVVGCCSAKNCSSHTVPTALQPFILVTGLLYGTPDAQAPGRFTYPIETLISQLTRM